jgi:hypothetical protein
VTWELGLNITSTLGTVLAAGLAWWAIKRGNDQAQASADALVRERRLDFEFDQLDRLRAAVEGGQWKEAALTLRLLPTRGLARARAIHGLPSTPAIEREISLHSRDGLLGKSAYGRVTYAEAILAEIEKAIADRLEERG